MNISKYVFPFLFICFFLILCLFLQTNCGGTATGSGTSDTETGTSPGGSSTATAPTVDSFTVNRVVTGNSLPTYTVDMDYNSSLNVYYYYYSTCTSGGYLYRMDSAFDSMTQLLTSSQIFEDSTACIDVDVLSTGSTLYIIQDLNLAILSLDTNGNATLVSETQIYGSGGLLETELERSVSARNFRIDSSGNIYLTDTNPDSYALLKYVPSSGQVTSILEEGIIEDYTGLDVSEFILHQVRSDGFEGFDNESGLYLKIAITGDSISSVLGFFPDSYISGAALLDSTRVFFNDYIVDVYDNTTVNRTNLGGGASTFETSSETHVVTNEVDDEFILSNSGAYTLVDAENFLDDADDLPDCKKIIETDSSLVLVDYYYGQAWEIEM